jgi:hypothetical protein
MPAVQPPDVDYRIDVIWEQEQPVSLTILRPPDVRVLSQTHPNFHRVMLGVFMGMEWSELSPLIDLPDSIRQGLIDLMR